MAAPTPLFATRTDTAHDADGPAVRSVDAILRRAAALHASDIHIEPGPDGRAAVRLRIDGILTPIEPLPAALVLPSISRLKLLASMDIANRRLPQDGRATFVHDGRHIDARIASIPTIDGEKLAIRLFDHQLAFPRLDDLGMEPAALAAYRAAAAAPWGFVVVGGPTGSGKTTTLYASLAELDSQARSICTVEDPIEARLAGIGQTQVNLRAGLTFPVVIRSFVRQDPDVIMIGEMRDPETVAVGINAALAGRIVFATAHSTDAARTIDRLLAFGVARHALAAALSAVVAQRLVRRLCSACRRPVARFFAPAGCAACGGTGYLGRVGLFEVLTVDEALRDVIASGGSSAVLARSARSAGQRTFADDALAKLRAGATSVAEVERVVGPLAA